MSRRIAVVGGGITGLTACYRLEQLGFEEVVLFDSGERLGGKLRTDAHAGFLVEAGPDSIFVRSQEILDFFNELGLLPELIEPKVRGFSILVDGILRAIPPGLSRIGKIDSVAIREFPALTDAGKAQALNERFVQPNEDADESVASFFRRRFGPEYAIKIAEPLYAGTHGGKSDTLSMEALYPAFRAAERRYGSLTAAAENDQSQNFSRFVSFREGSEALPKAVSKRLRSTKVHNRAVQSISFCNRRVMVDDESYSAAVLATSSLVAAQLLGQSAPEVSKRLKGIAFSSSIIVTLRFDCSDRDLGLFGTGFLVPESEAGNLRGATWSSAKWGYRSTDSRSLIRAFLRWQDAEDDILLETAREDLKRVVGFKEVPSFGQVVRWKDGLPQYRVGHPELIRDVECRLAEKGPVFLAGQCYRGAGIPDSVRQGKEAAESIEKTL